MSIRSFITLYYLSLITAILFREGKEKRENRKDKGETSREEKKEKTKKTKEKEIEEKIKEKTNTGLDYGQKKKKKIDDKNN